MQESTQENFPESSDQPPAPARPRAGFFITNKIIQKNAICEGGDNKMKRSERKKMRLVRQLADVLAFLASGVSFVAKEPWRRFSFFPLSFSAKRKWIYLLPKKADFKIFGKKKVDIFAAKENGRPKKA